MSMQEKKVITNFVGQILEEKSDLHRQRINGIPENFSMEHLKEIGIPREGRALEAVMKEMEEEIYQYQINSNHPRFFGFVPSPASNLSWIGDIMTSAYNIQAGGCTLAPAVACAERELIHWFCKQAGFTEHPGGVFVSGGSMANMTALIAARDQKLTEETFELGVAYVSDQTHSSLAKGLRMIGIPNKRIRKIPTDSTFRMDMKQLERAIRRDLAAGLIPFVVVGTAGTTNTGSIDPLEKIAEICKQYDMWFHVDGAYGGSVLLAEKHRHLLDGVRLADSMAWDAHKWLFQTYGCAMVLVKDVKNLFHSFHTNPEYLKDLETEGEEINPWDIGMELSRPARGLKLWLTMQVLGSEAMSQSIEHGFQLAEWAEDELKQKKDWEIISEAQLAIVNFRYAPKGLSEEQKDEINLKISKKMIESGYAAVYTTVLNGKKVLRICAIHPEATEEDMRGTIRLLHKYAKELYMEERQNIEKIQKRA